MAPAYVELQDVIFEAGSIRLFDQLNVDLLAQCCTVLMGPAGSGKSTLLKIAAGLIPLTQGRALVEGKDWNSLSEAENIEFRSRIGVTFQNGALWANKSIYQNIELPLVFHRPQMPAAEVRTLIERFSKRLGLASQLDHRPSQLSLGEQKMVSFLRAIILDPPTLFLDDPTGSLDSQSREIMLTMLDEFHKAGKTLIVVTQDPNVTARLADRVLLLKNGTVLAHGPLREVARDSNPEIVAILTSVLSQAATYSEDILDLLSIDQAGWKL